MNKLQKKRILRLMCFTLLALVGIFILYLLYRFTGIGFKCPFYELTGFKCIGCGNTHALESILKLNIPESVTYNYIYPLEIGYIFLVYLFSAKNYIINGSFNYQTPCKAFDIIVLVIIVIWLPLRNILGV